MAKRLKTFSTVFGMVRWSSCRSVLKSVSDLGVGTAIATATATAAAAAEATATATATGVAKEVDPGMSEWAFVLGDFFYIYNTGTWVSL